MSILRAGLIGENISRTRLPAALEIMCAEAGWTLDFTLIDTKQINDFDFIRTVKEAHANGWTGVTVTHPYKTNARAYAGDGMNAAVAHLGASNTLVFGNNIAGYNTDYTGFLAAMRDADLPRIGTVVIAGAGGVAKAIAPALATLMEKEDAEILIHDTNAARAADLAKTTGPKAKAIGFDTFAKRTTKAHGLVNATPLGMAEYPGSAFDLALLSGQGWAFDAVYTPIHTPFLIAARHAGLQCITGFDLFRAMAIRSFEAYTGLEVDRNTVLPKLDRLKPD